MNEALTLVAAFMVFFVFFNGLTMAIITIAFSLWDFFGSIERRWARFSLLLVAYLLSTCWWSFQMVWWLYEKWALL